MKEEFLADDKPAEYVAAFLLTPFTQASWMSIQNVFLV